MTKILHNPKKDIQSICILSLMLLFSTLSWGQIATDGDYRSAATGNWSTAATWQVRTGSSWDTATVLPTTTNNVYIQSGHTITVNADAYCQDLHFNTTTTAAAIIVNNGIILQVNRKIRTYTPGTVVVSTGADGVFYSSQISSAANSPIITTTDTGKIQFVYGGAITTTGEWGANPASWNAEFAIAAGATGTLGTNFKAGSINIVSGTLSLASHLRPDGGPSGTGTLTVASGATLKFTATGNIERSGTTHCGSVTVNGTLEYSGSTSTGKIDAATVTFAGTVIYSGGNQTLVSKTYAGSANPTNYNTLILSGSNTKTLPANITIAASGSLSLQGSTALAAGAGSFTVSYGTNATLDNSKTGSHAFGIEWPATNGPTNITLNSGSASSFTVSTSVSRTVTGTFALTGLGNFIVNTTNTLNFANGSTITRTAGQLNLSSGTVTIGSSATDVVNLTINGDITSSNEFIGGALNPGKYGVLTIAAGKTYTLTNSSKAVNSLVLNGNLVDGGAGAILTVRGNVTGAGTHSGTGKILLSGNTTSSSISAATFGNLDLNDSDGFSLSGSPSVNGTLSLTAGIVSTSTNTLTINAAGSVTKTAGWVNGKLKKFIPSAATTATFEIGDATNYAPVTTAFTGTISEATGSIIATTTGSEHPQIASSGMYSNKTVNRFWTLTNDNAITGLTSYDPTFTFVSGDVDAAATTTNFVVRNYNSSAWNSPTTGTKTTISTQATGLTAFGDFAIGELKVPVISYTGSLLTFTTAEGNPSVAQSISISGSDMNAGVLVTPPSGFEVATSADFSTTIGTNSAPLTIGTSGTITATTIYVRMQSSTTVASSPYTGDLTLSSSGASTVSINIPSSTVTATAVPAISLSTTSLTAFPKIAASSNSDTSQNFIVGGINLGTNAITITPPTHFKISLTDVNASYSSTAIVLTPSSGTVANTTIYVKYSPTGTGNISGNSGDINISNDVVSTQTVSVTGNGLNTFYYNSNSIATPSNWTALPNGTGDNPTNFSTDGITYKILNNASTDAAWTVSGIGSKVVLGDSSASPVTFTIADTFPLTGTIDITAASSGSNSLILNNNEAVTSPVTPSPLIFGSLDATSEVHFRCLIAVSGSKTFGKVFVDGGSFVNFPTFSGTHRILTSLEVAQNSFMFGSGTAANYLNCTGASVTINGTLKTTRTSGFTNNSITPGSSFGVIQFSGPDAITLGASSTIEYSRDTSNSTQYITPRSDYNNLIISGDNNIKTLVGNTTILGLLTLNMTSSTATPVVISSLNTGNYNLTLSTTASAVFGPGSVLNISGGTTDFGGRPVTFQSTATGTARIATILGTLNGATNVTVERYIPAKRAWRALTAPLKGNNSSIFSTWQNNGTVITGTGVELWSATGGNGLATGPGNSILQYDNSAGAWSPVTNTNTTNLFTTSGNNAFMLFPTGSYGSGLISSSATPLATTLKATGQLITGNVNYTGLSNTSHTLIGNPYASPIDLNSILDANASLEKYFWVWDPNGTNFGTYNTFDATLNTYSVTNVSYANSTVIQSGQAFFVKALSGQSGSFTITESNKSALTTSTVFKTINTDPELLRVNLHKQENNEWLLRDATLAGFFIDAEANQTANKLANVTENIAFTKNGNYFASEHHLPLVSTDTLNVRIWKTTAGANYKLKINTEQFTTTGLDATLQDMYTNSNTPLSLDGTAVEYPFTVTSDATSSGDRLRIVFSPTLGSHNFTNSSIKISPNPIIGDSFQVSLGSLSSGNYDYFITNSIGQEIGKGSIMHNEQVGSNTVKMRENVAAGIYIVKIIGTDKSVYTTKLIKQ